jgi:hypothetical protein
MTNSTKKNNPDLERKNSTKTISFFAVVTELLADLPIRSQDIVKKRFGLSQEKGQTLEKIGKDCNITRERVRQIVTDALKKVSQKKNEENFKEAEKKIVWTIEANGGIIKEKELIKKLSAGSWKEANAVSFFRACLHGISTIEDDHIDKSWVLDKKVTDGVKEVGLLVKEILKAEKRLFEEIELIEKVLPHKKHLSHKEVGHYLSVLVGVEKNQFEKWGLAEWEEINPKGTRERIYAVLREKKNPLHFSEIAKYIDEYGLSKKKAHLQTVHNELIKHEQFVLIGRGVYALREWGYAEGTIKDVLKNILSQKALTKEEILKEVSKVRQVKKATVLINLGNSKMFVKENNLYRVR